MLLKYKGKVMNVKHLIASFVINITIKILLVYSLYNTLRVLYVTNAFLAIMLMVIGLWLIKDVNIELEWSA